jgi:phage-related protein
MTHSVFGYLTARRSYPHGFISAHRAANPVREWILALSSDDRQTIGKDIQKVEFGCPIGRPHCAPLGHGLWEVRSDLANNRIARVVFCMGEGYMILLHGFIKKTQKAPRQDIDLALMRKREVT